ncbi:ABC transporter substrate-binding protein [Streptomyces sp. NPDC001315]|uniref:ABC transporter substrate-binding protein n=1 Tax=Streptomyces sp. NPDC001315 TaxID=3364562 RepID=UPI0036BED162
MTRLSLSACLSPGLVTDPLANQSPEGIDWTVSHVHPSEMFWRQLKFSDFDISEMSLATLLIQYAQGVRDWVALPVFTMRRFFHTGIVVRADSDIRRPEDLKGARVGVPEYQQTSAVWSRGALQHEFGVAPCDMTWFMERPPGLSHGDATGFTPPPGVTVSQLDGTDTLAEMFVRGELDASLVHLTGTNLIDRGGAQGGRHAPVRPLFDDGRAEGLRYLASTGILPVNHCVVIRRSIAEEHPWVVLNVYAAFERAKAEVLRRTAELVDLFGQVGITPPEAADSVASGDPLPYGFAGQRHVLETLAGFLHEQGLVGDTIDPASVFAEQTLTL